MSFVLFALCWALSCGPPTLGVIDSIVYEAKGAVAVVVR